MTSPPTRVLNPAMRSFPKFLVWTTVPFTISRVSYFLPGIESILEEMLSRCDFVVLCIELNDSTYHIIGDKELSALKKTAVLVNMGRGKLVDEAAFVSHLKDRTFFGAGLDTVETEPLPADSPLWDLDNVILTPHMTPAQPDKDEIMLSYILKNIGAYRRGESYVNRVSEGSLFTVNL